MANNLDKIILLANKNNGFISNADLIKFDISTKYLTLLLKGRKIEKVKPGLYVLANSIIDEFYAAIYGVSAVFSHAASLYLHNFSDRTPLKFDVTVANNYAGNLSKNHKINLFYIKNELLNIGIEKIKTPQGSIVDVYDIERTICDIIRNEKRIETEIFISALQKYARYKNKKLNVLLKYASLFGIAGKVEEKLRILL